MTTTRHPGAPTGNQADRGPQPRRSRKGQPQTERTTGPAFAVVPVKRLFAEVNRNYFLLAGTTLFLVIFGLVMVLSASSVEETSSGNDAFRVFARQGMFAVIGIPLMLIASRLPARFWKRWAWPALLVGGGLQLLIFVPGLGLDHGGNQNWLYIGSLTVQPSEFVKIALVVWLGWVLAKKQDLLGDWKHVFLPIAPVAGAAIGFVLLGSDLGTAFIMLAIVLSCLFFAGVRLKFLLVTVLAIAVVGFVLAQASLSRVERITVWMQGCTADDYAGYCWQTLHAQWALASGGLFGVGLGNSKAKWNWLPEADNDFIFAVIGEELGLVGAVVVLVLFIVLAIAFVRIIRATRDTFVRVVTAGVMVWVIGQAFVNIAVVLGVLPVLGVPLPLISAGGSALIATLGAIGIVLSFARDAAATAPAEPVQQSPAQRSRLVATQRARQR